MFSNGTEYHAFLEQNCSSCALYRPDADFGKGCHIEEAITAAGITGSAADFPFDWLDDRPEHLHQYDCRCKARKKPNPIKGNEMRQQHLKPPPKMTDEQVAELTQLLSWEGPPKGDA